MSEPRTLTDRTVCVTGASSGFGRAIAEHLGGLGAHVFLAGRTREPMEASAAAIQDAGGRADIAVFDVTDTGALTAWIRGAAEQTGRLDVMINNAGFGVDPGGVIDGDPEAWKAMFDVNVIALAAGCQAAVLAMRSSGSEGNIINISSTAALKRETGLYGATKHAVDVIGSTLRSELEADPIRVTTIKPGVFSTNFLRNMDRDAVTALANRAGITEPDFDEQGRLPRDQIDAIADVMRPIVGQPVRVAEAIEYVIGQPIELNIEELVIRPQKSMFG